jgi:hypothetical protein
MLCLPLLHAFLPCKPACTACGACVSCRCPVGGFNVSNLMGMKRRMIDLAKNNYSFFALGAFLKAGIYEVEIGIKFCVFLYHIDIFKGKIFFGS